MFFIAVEGYIKNAFNQIVSLLTQNKYDVLPASNWARPNLEKITFSQLIDVLKNIEREKLILDREKVDKQKSIEKFDSDIQKISQSIERKNNELLKVKSDKDRTSRLIESIKNSPKPTAYDEFITDKTPGFFKRLFLRFVSKDSITQAENKVSNYQRLQSEQQEKVKIDEKIIQDTKEIEALNETKENLKKEKNTAERDFQSFDDSKDGLSQLSNNLMENLNMIAKPESSLGQLISSSLKNEEEATEEDEEDTIFRMDF